MNQDILQGKRRKPKGLLKEHWGRLTDDDLDRIEGHAERPVGFRQQRYGYAREKAEEEYKRVTGRSFSGGDPDQGHAAHGADREKA